MRFHFSLKSLVAAASLVAIVFAGAVYWRTPRLEPDIKARIRADFTAEHYDDVRRILLAYGTDSPRMHRCILHVANGDLYELKRCADSRQKDYRDVVLSAEYEMTLDGMKKARDYRRPFDQADEPPFDTIP